VKLACVIPLFNFLGDPRLETNYLTAVAKLTEPEVDICPIRAVAHACEESSPFVIPTHSILWQKEALINRSFNLLAGSYDAIAWIDSGIYLQPGWSTRVLKSLETYDVVQCYNRGTWLNRQGRESSYRDGYVHNLQKGIAPTRGKPKPSIKPSVGAAWAARSSTLQNLRLYDRSVVGGGDTWTINGVLGVDTPEALVTRTQTEAQRLHVNTWVEKTRALRLRVGYTEDAYTHLWHLDADQRQHYTRHKMLVNHDFDPGLHTVVSSTGALEWTPWAPPELVRDVKGFLLSRVDARTPSRGNPPFNPPAKLTR